MFVIGSDEFNPVYRGTEWQEIPPLSRIKQARANKAKIARHTLHPLGARPPVAESSHIEVGTNQHPSREDLDPELASFCQRFNLEPQFQGFESDGDEDNSDAPPDGPEIAEQSELEHFSAVLQRAQQIAVQLEKEKEKSKKCKTPNRYTGKSQMTSYRHKRARFQLAEKGFFRVFKYFDLQ
ncbi:hypothetical protein EDB85DRAFT_1899154 [Lactarius pseudohatsudake]|nr:hypothetical protein EDB85DRAFT_1899154 [Lactarius pseudohatsudake]